MAHDMTENRTQMLMETLETVASLMREHFLNDHSEAWMTLLKIEQIIDPILKVRNEDFVRKVDEL